jgi:hypothetical protein
MLGVEEVRAPLGRWVLLLLVVAAVSVGEGADVVPVPEPLVVLEGAPLGGFEVEVNLSRQSVSRCCDMGLTEEERVECYAAKPN